MGYFTAMDYWCCRTCAWSSLDDEEAGRAVFWASNMGDVFNTDGNLTDHLYLSWSGDALDIMSALSRYGLATFWVGKEDRAIEVIPRG